MKCGSLKRDKQYVNTTKCFQESKGIWKPSRWRFPRSAMSAPSRQTPNGNRWIVSGFSDWSHKLGTPNCFPPCFIIMLFTVLPLPGSSTSRRNPLSLLPRKHQTSAATQELYAHSRNEPEPVGLWKISELRIESFYLISEALSIPFPETASLCELPGFMRNFAWHWFPTGLRVTYWECF